MTGPEHYREAEAKLAFAWRISHPDSGHSDEEAVLLASLAFQRAQVHATLAAAPRPWLRCVEQRHDAEHYLLNPAYVHHIERHESGWWQAIDTVTGRIHRILSDDDAKVEALSGGQS